MSEFSGGRITSFPFRMRRWKCMMMSDIDSNGAEIATANANLRSNQFSNEIVQVCNRIFVLRIEQVQCKENRKIARKK